MNLLEYPLSKGKETFELLKSAYKNFYRDNQEKLAYLDIVKNKKSKRHKFYNIVGLDATEYINELSYRGSSLYNFFHGEKIKREFDPQKIEYLNMLIDYYNSNRDLGKEQKVIKEKHLLKLELTFKKEKIEPYSFKNINRITEDALLLLLLDRFPIGVWGRSLAMSSQDYGNKDPGSITVSLWVMNLLDKLGKSNFDVFFQDFKIYLIERRSAKGGIGMKKDIGSALIPETDIRVHPRHTATGALFLLKYGKSWNLALQSIVYVIGRKTDAWSWTTIRPDIDKNADPLTTAYILNAIKSFETLGFLENLEFNEKQVFLTNYWELGIEWLYKKLINNSNWWFIPNSEHRKYCFTVDILDCLLEHYKSNEKLDKIIRLLVPKLIKIWQDNGNGIPLGNNQSVDLRTSVQFCIVCYRIKDIYPEYHKKVETLLSNNIDFLMNLDKSDSAGWCFLIDYILMNNDGFDNTIIETAKTKSNLIEKSLLDYGIPIREIVDVLDSDFLKKNIKHQLEIFDIEAN